MDRATMRDKQVLRVMGPLGTIPGGRSIRVLALIHPREQQVGHWSGSSSRLHVTRLVMEGEALKQRLAQSLCSTRPEVIAVTSKAGLDYLDLLDEVCVGMPDLATVPRVFRCQNTALNRRLAGRASDRVLCKSESGWFRLACDPRWAMVLVQTLDDVALMRTLLAPTRVAACPYGYDPDLFNPDLAELPRTIDVGCYMTVNGKPGRARLLDEAARVCDSHGYSFRCQSGIYGRAYADLIRSTKIHLHWAVDGEVPYRLYESTVLGTVFLTNPLHCGVDMLFRVEEEYVTYRNDLSDLARRLAELLDAPEYRRAVGECGQRRARGYAWPCVADAFVAPALDDLLSTCESPPRGSPA
jgi:hypothetical protein